MKSAVHRHHRGNDRPLAAVFARNAEGFLRGAQEHQNQFPDITRYSLAVAIELSLKAYLLHRGISDDWNRIHIRHDLTKALRCARRAGFMDAPPGLAPLAAALGPYYQTHAILRMPASLIASVDWAKACEAADALLNGVNAAIGRHNGDAPHLIRLVAP